MLPETLMIVEDEALTRRFLQSVAEKLGVRVLGSCDNGAALLEKLSVERPEMILMDINIKGPLDGLQTVRRIYRTHPIPIIFITAYTDSDTLTDAMQLSPYGFIAKPVTPKELEIALKLACVRCRTDKNLPEQTLLLTDGFIYHKTEGSLLHGGNPVRLSQNERQLLRILSEHPGKTVISSTLETLLWPLASPGPEALPSLIKRFRKKTSKHLIQNLYGDGYSLTLL